MAVEMGFRNTKILLKPRKSKFKFVFNFKKLEIQILDLQSPQKIVDLRSNQLCL